VLLRRNNSNSFRGWLAEPRGFVEETGNTNQGKGKIYGGARDRKYQFWERNPKTKLLDSREVVEQKLDYIHNNPVQGKWMLTSDPCEYKFSSAKFY
jgi:hypothetical protein